MIKENTEREFKRESNKFILKKSGCKNWYALYGIHVGYWLKKEESDEDNRYRPWKESFVLINALYAHCRV